MGRSAATENGLPFFSSAMTVAIGAFFTDLDLETYHAAPISKARIVATRWGKTFAQSATIILVFTIPIFIAFARQYQLASRFYAEALLNLALLLTLPVTLGSLVIIALVRYFPVQRVHQIVASIAMLVLTVAVIGFRMSKPERFFMPISTDDLARVLQTIELPSIERYPGTALADLMVDPGRCEGAVLFHQNRRVMMFLVGDAVVKENLFEPARHGHGTGPPRASDR